MIQLILSFGTALASSLSIQLPSETIVFKPGPGSEVANAQCLICHSADYVSTQAPTSSRLYWKSTVLKMKKTFGAPIPDDQIEPLVNYLVKTYGIEKRKN